ncbi:ABC transporter substrate-binding protein [Paenibacillus sp. NPDC057967]|uniref:ABC transporter substrate-binding protein n=1 Tax=Paenibacillus sp. NPDC057967 TaxID=3346293 RepID=UPI0036DDB1B7
MLARNTHKVMLGLILSFTLVLGACGNGEKKEPGDKPETRVVSTVKGDVEIPAEPKRIVALYYHHILFAMDVKPVGANLTWWGGSPFLAEQEKDLVDVGGPPSLEAVAALNPDLIIMNSNNEENYDELAKIAPSILIPYDGSRNPYEDAKLVAEVLGKPDAAESLEKKFNEKAEAARKRVEGKVTEDTTAAIIRIEGKGSQFSVFGDNYGRSGWSIYHGLNLKMPDIIKTELVDSNAQIVQQLALERLPEYVADADYIFVSNEGEGLDQLQNSEVWKSLPAVKNNKVIELDKTYFFFDPISIEGQLDLITDLIFRK